MSQSIDKPTAATYYRAHGPNAIHEGITDPGLVTTTGQPNLIHSTDPGVFAGLVADSGSAVEPMPDTGEEVQRGRVYDFSGTVYVCVQSHTRTADDPANIPALFTPARAQLAAWVQPTGAHDAYATGDLVTHDNPNDGGAIWVYESTIDANTAEPGRDGTFDRWWQPIEPVA